jgi:glycosyltransferase involved in cell wall biosynthesis
VGLRVVIVTPWGERLGGAEEMLWLTLRHCDRARLEPSVVFLSPGPFEREVAALGFETEVVPATRIRRAGETLPAVWQLRSILRRRRPDLLLNWSAKSQIYASTAAALAGMGGSVVWWQHQIPDGHWIDRLATLLPTRAVGCSSDAARRAQSSLWPRRSSFVVNPGIEIGAGAGGDPAGLREELGIPRERLVVGIVGRLQPWKGQDRLVKALADLRARGHDVHGLIVGGVAYDLSPGYAAELEQLVADLGLSDRVTMTGQVPDSTPYLGLMDVAVNASEEEPFGIVLLEAMAAGVPVVAVGNGGPLDIVVPGETGMLAAGGEPAQLADAIDELLASPDLRAEVAKAARERCGERFTAAQMADRLTSKLAELAG